MPYALCPMPYALCPVVPHMRARKAIPLFYQTHLQQHLTRTQFLVLSILLNLLQSERQVKLEQLAPVFPYPITALCRRRP
jgi:hypothetical protein